MTNDTKVFLSKGWSLLELLVVLSILSGLAVLGWASLPRGKSVDMRVVYAFQEARLEALESGMALTLDITPLGERETRIQSTTGYDAVTDMPLRIQAYSGEPLYDALHLRYPVRISFDDQGRPNQALIITCAPTLRFLLLRTGAIRLVSGDFG